MTNKEVLTELKISEKNVVNATSENLEILQEMYDIEKEFAIDKVDESGYIFYIDFEKKISIDEINKNDKVLKLQKVEEAVYDKDKGWNL